LRLVIAGRECKERARHLLIPGSGPPDQPGNDEGQIVDKTAFAGGMRMT